MQIKKTDGTVLGVVVVQSTNDFTLVMTMTTNTWAFGVEGATYWVDSGAVSGLHGYDLSTWANGAGLRMESWNGDGDFGPASIGDVSIQSVLPYDQWLKDNFLTGTNALRTADVEPDGMDNLLEYALGGNPNLNDAAVVLPVSSVVGITGTTWLEYVYNRRIDSAARGLDYGIILRNDLITGSWSNIGTAAESDAAPISTNFETVTNHTATTESMKFINLEVTEN